ncbi:MAG: hypothetical protein K2H75_00770, partial [Muribaculaceae bacterium]|nr:hypothetical protein [Muribaculaceae bacterium]
MRLPTILTITLLFPLIGVQAQNTAASDFENFRKEKKAEFERFRQEKKTEFELYRKQLNEEYAAMIAGEWKAYKKEPSREIPTKPKPVKPIVVRDDSPVQPRKVVISGVTEPEKSIPDIPVTIPKITPEIRKTYPVNFTFFNTQCGIEQFDTSALSLNATDNSSLAKTWKQLTANEKLEPLLNDCLRLREELQLCDWAYLLLIEKVAATLYPKSADSQAFLTVALLNQSGYDCRLGIKGGKLMVMFHPSHTLYGQPYYNIDGKAYFIRGQMTDENTSFYTYSGDFRKSPTPIRMTIDRYPRLSPKVSAAKTYSSASWKKAPPFEVTVNSSVVEFFNSYPQVDWHIYGLAPVSEQLQSTLFPVMEILTEGLGEEEAVNLLLSFHNYGFDYMTDGDQFGREKPFFFDENFYYPYNDGEARA